MPISKASITNPHKGEDMLVTFSMCQKFNGVDEDISISLRYVPDRDVISEENFKAWVQTIAQKEWPLPEHIAHEIMSKFYDTILPFFVEFRMDLNNMYGVEQNLKLVKQQPQYKLPRNLERML